MIAFTEQLAIHNAEHGLREEAERRRRSTDLLHEKLRAADLEFTGVAQ